MHRGQGPRAVRVHEPVVDHRRRSESSRASIFATSWEVRNPSKKWRNGTGSSVVAWATRARSCASCTDEAHGIANPSSAQPSRRGSPKIESACVATVRAAVYDERGQLARDLEHVGQHEQQAL